MRIILFAIVALLAVGCWRAKQSYRLIDKNVNSRLSEEMSLTPLWEGVNGFYLTDSTTLDVIIQDGAIVKIIRVLDYDSTSNTTLFDVDKPGECDFNSCYDRCLSDKGGRDGNGSCYFECYSCRVTGAKPAPILKEY